MTLQSTPDLWEATYFPNEAAHYAPDVAVEIRTPDETPDEIARKVADYLRQGTPVVWVIDPQRFTVDVHTQAGVRHLTRFGTLSGEDVMPGAMPNFELPIKRMFGR